MTTGNEAVPHANLYTRLQPSPGKGIGLFAIRDIPQGLDPFRGDVGPTVLLALSNFDKIEDPEIRRFYLDFCPFIDGAFVAPADLNQITPSWYMNHSKEPNVASDRDATFVASRLIRKGEELTVDYTRFSDHAERYARDWKAKA